MMDKTPSQSSETRKSSLFLVGLTSSATPSRVTRSRRGFAAGKSRLSLQIDADCAVNGDAVSVTGQSTPASTSSSCSSDVVPWWEVEYRCPPPGHLGAHVVPVSVEEGGVETVITAENTTKVEVHSSTNSVFSTLITSTPHKINAIRAGMMVYETPERAKRGANNKLAAIRSSVPCLLVDSSPSQKRKMRSQDFMESDSALFSTHAAKELKRFHVASCDSLKKAAIPSRVVTPSTLVQPLTQIVISETLRPKPKQPHTETSTP